MYSVVLRCKLSTSSMTAWEEVVSVSELGEPVGDYCFQGLFQSVEESDRPVGLRLCVVILSWFPENYRDRLLEMCRAISQLKAGVEEPVKSRKKNV